MSINNIFDKKEWSKAYLQRPEVKERLRLYRKEYDKTPGRIEYKKKYWKRRNQTTKRKLWMSNYNKEYRKKNAGKIKYYRRENKERINLWNKNKKNKLLAMIHDFTNEEWQSKLTLTKGACPICETYVGIKKLTIDHIKPIYKVQSGTRYTIEDVQPLCKNCNSKKGIREVSNEELKKEIFIQ